MPTELEPPELARVVDFAERARAGGWSLRSALTRYAQGQPVRTSQVMELVRRIEAALHPHSKLLARDGPALWRAADSDAGQADPTARVVVGLLRAAAQLDRLGDALAVWAQDWRGDRPHTEVDATVAAVTDQLDALGVPREQREGPPPRRRRG